MLLILQGQIDLLALENSILKRNLKIEINFLLYRSCLTYTNVDPFRTFVCNFVLSHSIDIDSHTPLKHCIDFLKVYMFDERKKCSS